MKFDVKVDVDRAIAALNQMASRGRDLTPVMADIASFLLVVVENAFEEERDPTTLTPWEQLANSTIEQRRKRGTWPGKKLFDSGDMQRAVIPDSDATSAGVGIAASLHTEGDRFFYPAGLQFGTRKMPARPFLGLSPADEDSILGIVGGYLIPD